MSNKLNLTDEAVRERILQGYKRACVIDSNCEFDCKPGSITDTKVKTE